MTKVVYTGPSAYVSALAQSLREQGVEVDFVPPVERRGAAEVFEAVVVSLACSGAYDAIKAGVNKFRASRLGKVSKVEVDEQGDDA